MEETGAVLPGGTVTLLLADVEGSTRLWEAEPEVMTAALARLEDTVSDVLARHGGVRPLEQGEGDSFVAAFTRASDAVAAALDLQLAELDPIRLRIGIHTGEVQLRDGQNYAGPVMNRVARLRDLGHGGQTLISQASHDMVVEHLPGKATLTDLGTHRLKDLARPEHVHQLGHPELPDDFPPLRSVDAYPNNLPVQLTSFIGRERELDELRQLIGEHRLVTLTGSGGAGKTRLALQLAAEVLSDFPDGVWMVELGAVTDPDLVATSVARVFGYQDDPDRSTLETVVHHLRTKTATLVLDNCEHLVGAVAELADALLHSCPTLTVLATSREPLGVSGEVTWRVPSLSLPSSDGRSEAVELFVERARRGRADFALTDANRAGVAEICARVDGLPLAIELAAARVRVLAPEQIAAGLHDRFRLLTGGARTAVPRQQTLRASVDWSFNLLTEPEQALLRQLAVFAGSFDVTAAETVCAGEGLASHQVLDQLSLLVDKSLVVADASDGTTRYRLLETVRHYAAERLAQAGEADATRDRHATHYMTVAWAEGLRVYGPEQDRALATMVAELENFRAASNWAAATGRVEEAMSIGVALVPLFGMRNYLREGASWLDATIVGSQDVNPATKALALAFYAMLSTTDNPEGSVAAADDAVAIARDLGDPLVLFFTVRAKAYTEVMHDPEQAIAHYEEVVAWCRSEGDTANLGLTLQLLGSTYFVAGEMNAGIRACLEALDVGVATQNPGLQRWSRVSAALGLLWLGQVDRASGLLDGMTVAAQQLSDRVAESTALCGDARMQALGRDPVAGVALAAAAVAAAEEVGTRFHRAVCRIDLVVAFMAAGDAAAARTTMAEVLQLSSEIPILGDWFRAIYAETALAAGDLDDARTVAARSIAWAAPRSPALPVAWAFRAGARVALAGEDPAEAEELSHRALAAAHEIGDPYTAADALEMLAATSRSTDEGDRGARLLGAAEALRDSLGNNRFGVYQDWHDDLVSDLRRVLGDDGFDGAWSEGTALSLDEAVTYAQRGRGERKRPSSGWASLTPAELDVVRLVAEGLPNKEIAARLFISPRTVQAHLTHVYAKVGVTSRVQLATEAAKRS